MRVSSICSMNSTYNSKGNPVVIKAEDNKHVAYLYNKVQDAISSKQYKTGATFNLGTPGDIKIPSPPNGLVEYLTALGIKFDKSVK